MMSIQRSKQWWVSRAQKEDVPLVGAGASGSDADREANVSSVASAHDDTRIAFGRFVNLMRRQRGLTMERLAEEADLEPSELLNIEDDHHFRPEPRTVFQLATVFGVPQDRLMAIAGLTVETDAQLRREAVRFAARSESVRELTGEESAALAVFVSVLSERGAKPRR